MLEMLVRDNDNSSTPRLTAVGGELERTIAACLPSDTGERARCKLETAILGRHQGPDPVSFPFSVHFSNCIAQRGQKKEDANWRRPVKEQLVARCSGSDAVGPGTWGHRNLPTTSVAAYRQSDW